MGAVPSVGLFLRDLSPYLRKFKRKPRKTLIGYVDKHDRGLNPAPTIYQFRRQNHSVTGGAIGKMEYSTEIVLSQIIAKNYDKKKTCFNIKVEL